MLNKEYMYVIFTVFNSLSICLKVHHSFKYFMSIDIDARYCFGFISHVIDKLLSF